ncbi:hypothetical protein Acr_17g0009810 [Actinidia rufa]|uniref:Uncharacterized protein n=1 Tax=Actinidia rufa TaxID=165716 RepID=A0A7J0G3R1_9ERIC|nr:hypothetical protein Acr_17g0009810 [Actinidia rufa]
MRRSYDLHQAFFSISIDDMSLEEFYGKFCGICEEIDLSEPITANVATIKQKLKELPSLIEVFSHLRQASHHLLHHPRLSALPWLPLCGLIVLLGVVLAVGSDYSRADRSFGRGGRDSSDSGCGREHGPLQCTHYNQENYIIDRCWDLHGRLRFSILRMT